MSTSTSNNIRYLALGDSYTIGESVNESERFPVQLAEELKKNKLPVNNPYIIATTGWTTANLQTAINNSSIDITYDLVSLLIGVNNFYQGKSLEEYKIQFQELLSKSIELAAGKKNKVFVVSIPDYGYTPFGQSNQSEISEGIDLFNTSNKQITDSMGVKYFNITPISRNGLADPSLVANDGLHPSGKMYRQWVELMKGEVIQMVKTS